MELTHKLTCNISGVTRTVLCEEPIGFDNLKTRISRGEYHGMSVEVSVDSLEFHGHDAVELINDAYKNSVDTEVMYEVANGSTIVYSGKLDLTTFSLNESKYRSVSVKVGDVGTKTTFNNRTGTDVDINTTKTIDGANLSHVPSWKKLQIPMRHLLYTNVINQKKNVDFAIGHGAAVTSEPANVTRLIFDNHTINEFGIINQDTAVFYEGDGFDEKFGPDTKMSIDFNAKIRFSELSVALYSGYCDFYAELISGGTTLKSVKLNQVVGEDYIFSFSAPEIWTGNNLYFTIREYHSADIAFWNVKVLISWADVKMVMYDNLPNTGINADMLPVHDVLNTIVESISENALSVKSDLYGRPDSVVHPTVGYGSGALKALTNGYKIRGLYSSGEIERNMPISFKNAIESLDAIDCIGWCFEDAGVLRIEPWTWFYKDEVVLTINGANSIKREMDAGAVITELVAGYKKYATQSEYNSIDSFHGERKFVSNIKGIAKTSSKLCDFIADNYAIEETRRASSNVDRSEEFKYDENIFVIELAVLRSNGSYYIPRGVVSSSNISRPGEVINMSISPWYNACRRNALMRTTYGVDNCKFNTGTINYKAIYAVPTSDNYRLHLPLYGTHDENQNLVVSTPKFRAEKLTLDYPLTIDQYQAIISNPYGMVLVDGEHCYIKEFTYSFKDGMANFVLLPKYTA